MFVCFLTRIDSKLYGKRIWCFLHLPLTLLLLWINIDIFHVFLRRDWDIALGCLFRSQLCKYLDWNLDSRALEKPGQVLESYITANLTAVIFLVINKNDSLARWLSRSTGAQPDDLSLVLGPSQWKGRTTSSGCALISLICGTHPIPKIHFFFTVSKPIRIKPPIICAEAYL